MASGFGSLTLTDNGRNLLAKAQTGVQLSFTRVAVGDGILNGQDSTKFSHLLDEVISLNISEIIYGGSGTVTVCTTLDNSNLLEGFYWREIGVFATDPQLGEILYGYANAGAGEIYVPDKGTNAFAAPCNINFNVANADNVTAVIDQTIVYATKQDVSDIESGKIVAGHAENSDSLGGKDASTYAPLNSPALTGAPTAPTAAAGTNTTQLATTAFVIGQASPTAPQMDGAAAAGSGTTFARADHVHPTDSTRAPLNSPALTGAPTAPTAAAGTNTTQLATTAFVAASAATKVSKAGDAMTGALTLSGDPASNLQAATKQYVDNSFAANDAMIFKGSIDASSSPIYPAGNRGYTYKISVAGKIGGTSGVNVEVGDTIICTADGSAAGDQTTVGSNWTIVQTNIDGAVVGPTSSTAGNIPVFNGATGKVIRDSGYSVGNASGNVPLSNGTVNANLNADKLDGYDSTAFAPSGYGLGGNAHRLAGGTDLNTIVASGYFDCQNAVNGPSDLSGTNDWVNLHVFCSGDTKFVTQLVFGMASHIGYMYMRTMCASTWSPWYRVWTSAYMGTSSGLDADLLDGLEATAFLNVRTDITDGTWDINAFNLNSGSPSIKLYIERSSNGSANISNIPVTGQPFLLNVELVRWVSTSDYITRQTFVSITDKIEYVRWCTSGTWSSWEKNWSSLNDGPGSGLDADTLDGQQGSYYAPVSFAQMTKITADNGTYYLSVNNGDDIYAKLDALPRGLFTVYVQSGSIANHPMPGNYLKGICLVETVGSYLKLFYSTDTGGFGFLSQQNGIWTNYRLDGSVFATVTQGAKADAALPASSYTAADILSKIKTVDGSGSGVDADTLDGQHGSYYAPSTHTTDYSVHSEYAVVSVSGPACSCAVSGWTLTDGNAITIKSASSVSNATLNVNGLGAKSIYDNDGMAVSLAANVPYSLRYESSSDHFIVLGKGGVPAHSSQTYSTPGTYTFTVPAKVYMITVYGVAGGGGGCELNGGGGGEGLVIVARVQPGEQIPLTVGAGGSGGATAGTTGGNTLIFNTTVFGGLGGGVSSSLSSPTTGTDSHIISRWTGTGGINNATANASPQLSVASNGSNGWNAAGTSESYGGGGGASPIGGAGGNAENEGTVVQAGSSNGGGGGGGIKTNGADGAHGAIQIIW